MKIRKFTETCLTVGSVAFLFGAGLAQANGLRATADIVSCEDPSDVLGWGSLTEKASEEGVKEVDIALFVEGLPPGKHAVHIHEVGTCDPCSAARGHFDPGHFGMSNPDGNHPFHSGDLVNIELRETGPDNAVGAMQHTTSRVSLSPGPLSIFDQDGSAFIIHVDPDTYCSQGEAAGCAGGARAACGVITPISRRTL